MFHILITSRNAVFKKSRGLDHITPGFQIVTMVPSLSKNWYLNNILVVRSNSYDYYSHNMHWTLFILRIGESVSFCLSLFTYIFCYNLKKKQKKRIIYFMYIQYIIKFLSACCYIVFFFCLDDKRCLTNKPAWLNDKWDFPLPGGRSGFFEMKSSVFLLYSHFLSHIISLMMLFFPFLYRIKSAPRVGAELTLNVICLGWQNTPSSLCLISICGQC